MDRVSAALSHWRVQSRIVARAGLGTMSEVWFVDCDEGRLVLRGHRSPDRRSVEFEHSVMDVVRQGGLPAPLALKTPGGEVAVQEGDRWWSLLVWIEGDQPERGSHRIAQARSMGEVLGRIHEVLGPVRALAEPASSADTTGEAITEIEQLISVS